jgi:hypothetical protein
MVEQVERHIKFLPHADGICVDRGDWFRLHNPKGDDGLSWVDGKPTRILFQSWLALTAKIGPMLHKADKFLFLNAHTMRLESFRDVDGFYNEFGQIGVSLNTAALIGLRKPVAQWTYNQTLREPNPDSFMQRHLYMGCFPTAPYPYNNHCINPASTQMTGTWAAVGPTGASSAKDEQVYLDYGPLLNAMRGKKWVLTPHCVESADPAVRVNLFEVKDGYALPVTFAGSAQSATVRVRNLPDLKKLKTDALLPATETAQSVKAQFKDGVLELTVPLKNGCAMVRLRK